MPEKDILASSSLLTDTVCAVMFQFWTAQMTITKVVQVLQKIEQCKLLGRRSRTVSAQQNAAYPDLCIQDSTGRRQVSGTSKFDFLHSIRV